MPPTTNRSCGWLSPASLIDWMNPTVLSYLYSRMLRCRLSRSPTGTLAGSTLLDARDLPGLVRLSTSTS